MEEPIVETPQAWLRRMGMAIRNARPSTDPSRLKWRIRSDYIITYNPEVQCPWCSRMVPTQEIWVITKGNKLNTIYKIGSGEKKSTSRPHPHVSGGSICMGHNTNPVAALTLGMNPSSQYNHTALYFQRLGHWCRGSIATMVREGDAVDRAAMLAYNPEIHPMGFAPCARPDKPMLQRGVNICSVCSAIEDVKNPLVWFPSRYLWLCPTCKTNHEFHCPVCDRTVGMEHSKREVVLEVGRPKVAICDECFFREFDKCRSCREGMRPTAQGLCPRCLEIERLRTASDPIKCAANCQAGTLAHTIANLNFVCQGCGSAQRWHDMNGHFCLSCASRGSRSRPAPNPIWCEGGSGVPRRPDGSPWVTTAAPSYSEIVEDFGDGDDDNDERPDYEDEDDSLF